jgi:hypothetical protein
MAQHGLDLKAPDLAAELRRALPKIDRSVSGFGDFSHEGIRAIEPRSPARSLLYHAFASPLVRAIGRGSQAKLLKGFPTLAEIEAIEDYVFGAEPPSIEDLRATAGGARIAIAVYALEYRPGVGTVHRKHADLVFARTGVARVGTDEPLYGDAARGFLPFVESDGHRIRTLPCRYAAFVAALVPGIKAGHGPMRFIDGTKAADGTGLLGQSAGRRPVLSALSDRGVMDTDRLFWVPLHKLFSGNECIRGRSIDVRLAASHCNEKIRRSHLGFLSNGHNAGWSEPDISKSPFIFHDGIAELSTVPSDGSWLLKPTPHTRLAEPAEYEGKALTYLVPTSSPGDGPWRAYQSSLNLRPQPSGARTAPEYLHARHRSDPDGTFVDLNDLPDVINLVAKGGYWARHYVDHTGDGWIDVECSELALELPQRLPAYSIVSTPDFFPFVDQTALMQWSDQSILPSLTPLVWDAAVSGLPESLSDQRYAANLQLPGAAFDPLDDTVTAIVGCLGSGNASQAQLTTGVRERVSMLPDAAAGVFAPGWDVSYDRTSESDQDDTGKSLKPGVTFLNNYGLGSPFMEDSKLCAALSAFWPAAAPDITRTFAPSRNYATATPLTDEVIGLGQAAPWDGVKGPILKQADGFVDYPALAYADYVETALTLGFDISEIGKTTVEDYVARTLTMGLIYHALGVEKHDDKLKWSVLSFKPLDDNDPDLATAEAATGRRLNRQFKYRYVIFDHNDRGSPDPKDFKRVLVKYGSLQLCLADPTLALLRDSSGSWTVSELRR